MQGLCCISPLSNEGKDPVLLQQRLTMPASGDHPTSSSKASKDGNSHSHKPSHLLSKRDTPHPPGHAHTDPESELETHRKSPLHHFHSKSGPLTPDPPMIRSQLISEEAHDLKKMSVSRAASSNVAGILQKWVNYGRRWRPRWFVLERGLLHYYKVHGRDKIHLSADDQKEWRMIGEDAQRLLQKQKDKSHDDPHHHHHPRTPVGEVYVKVSSFRASKSNDRKFYIYCGTLTWDLKAETKEDRADWLEALKFAKEFSFIDVSVMLPPDEVTISTTRLKARLEEEGLSKESINECEKIFLSEFSHVQEQLKSLQKKRLSLINKLQQLEAEKVELETTVVDEMHNQKYQIGHHEHASEVDSEDDQPTKHDYFDAETDEEDDAFFDTKETLLSASSCGSFHELVSANTTGTSSLKIALSNSALGLKPIPLEYPFVRRRKCLPVPKEEEKAVSLWSLIKDNIGKDLTKVCLPVYFNEPVSTLQKVFEDLEYSFLLDQACEWGKKGNSLMRVLNVAAFAVSGYASTDGRHCKPFNPLLGETYEADFPDKGLRFVSEKVSHHPMIVACHCEGRGWRLWGDCNLKSKFWGRSIQLDPVGVLTLEFDDGEIFRWSKVTTSIYNLILGKLYCDHYGTMRIQGNREHSCKLKFKEQSIMDRKPHQVHGFVQNRQGEQLATLIGRWDESMSYVINDPTRPKASSLMSDPELLWKRNAPSEFPTRYNLTSFAITLNELTPGIKEKLPPTDSRLRPDQRHLENGEYEQANLEKLRLEQKQRKARKVQERGWEPQWFRKLEGKDSFQYVGGYWESRETKNWKGCPNIFGPELPDILE